MPKRVVAELAAALEREIRAHYRIGQPFPSVRELARRHRVSPPSAHAAVQQLVSWGLLAIQARSGAVVTGLQRDLHRQRRRMLVLSRTFETEYYNAVLRGVRRECGEHCAVSFLIDPAVDVATLPHGEYLLGLGYPAIIALGLREAVLPLYYLQSHGVDVVSSVAVPELPELPVVQLDAARHGRNVVRALQRARKRGLILVSSWLAPEAAELVRVVTQEFLASDPACRVKTISLRRPGAAADLRGALLGLRDEDALVAIDGGANAEVAEAFAATGLAARGNLFLFEAGDDVYIHPRLPPLPTLAPSYFARGQRLAQKILAKMETGAWPEPRLELM
jgi:DNA-binding transcriptional regulator YhcF (GntR family)